MLYRDVIDNIIVFFAPPYLPSVTSGACPTQMQDVSQMTLAPRSTLSMLLRSENLSKCSRQWSEQHLVIADANRGDIATFDQRSDNRVDG